MPLKTGTALSLVGPKGPVGDQGQATPALGSVCFAAGPQGYLSNGPSTASGIFLGIAGLQNPPAAFTPTDATALLGATITNYGGSSASFSFALVNVTAGTTIYTSAAYAANSINTIGVFSQTAYAMPANNRYQWRCIGAGTAYVSVQPFYMLPSNAAIAASTVQTFALPSTVTLGATAVAMYLPGTTSSSYLRLPRAGYVYSLNVTNNTASAVTLQIYNTTTSTAIYTVTAPANASTTLGPFGPVNAPLLPGNNYQLRAAGSGAADLTAQLSLVS